ncbi:sodium-dependent transporter, SNF family [Campylobacter blaseri]|uniref:Transporter n=1 Tax=Campylobacter blaseri TaxID=2042961 RepID=A0A2P8R446_9BACT|nr:sodium-dependent transporter [Campylobacter blaseri]PSM53271.1 sodium-dependent transporter [Campylobacter blaseri]PSM54737.1 sodium-dependent transporter [Campylobacter blaseri]QKF86781.1 sodium-dependent transporter, SNF family [Campylobacter blaseri]
MNKRETWSNKLTYVLTVAGATIGFGCTWRFPYLVGENGGGAYVLLFCIAMIILGIPMMLVQNVIGRRAMKNSVDAFIVDKRDGSKISKFWRFVGYMGLIGAFGILAYYMVLGGWVMTYISNIIMHKFILSAPITKEYTEAFYYKNIEHNPLMVGFYTFLFVAVNWYILKKGIINGIEKFVKFLMPFLFLCFITVIIANLNLDGAKDGISFYLGVDFSKINAKLFIDVLGQVFFALSLGFGVMITLSSHLSKDENLIQTATFTGVINTIIAVMAGFMIFPAIFTAGLEPAAGPSLVFKTLPIAFSYIPFGGILAVVFFIILMIAALTTSITIYQVIIGVLEEKLNMNTTKATTITLLVIFIFGNIPSVLAYGPWQDILVLGRNIFDAFDFISANIFFTSTAFMCCVYVGWILKEDAIYEISNANKLKSPLIKIWYNYIKYVLPVIILVVFIAGLTTI